MRYKNKIYVDLPRGPAGTRDNGSYLYIGKPQYDFSETWNASKVYIDGRVFWVKRAELIRFGGRPLYVWAVLYPAIEGGKYAEY
ncbi:MAG: hypothetical protein IKL44_03295 [Clostridia bacterium]|nr:hypothetical protein [Clostridia bacterium]MBR3593680.1 hypothetical protein [Clostridia bacterium]